MGCYTYWVFNEDLELINVTNVDPTNPDKNEGAVCPEEWSVICTSPIDLCGMFALQDIFQRRLQQTYNPAYIFKNAQYVDQELHEMMREVPFFKSWKNYSDWDYPKHLDLAKDELIDAFHFFMNISNALGMDALEFCERYYHKYQVNHLRQDEGY